MDGRLQPLCGGDRLWQCLTRVASVSSKQHSLPVLKEPQSREGWSLSLLQDKCENLFILFIC